MNFSQITSKVSPTGSETRGEYEAEQNQEPRSTSSTWRRKSVLAAAALGVGMYLRRKRSRRGEGRDPGATDGATRDGRGGVGRRLKQIVLGTLAVALLRRIVRRFGSSP